MAKQDFILLTLFVCISVGYSNGTTIVSAFNDTVHGGECLSGLKLEVYINSELQTVLSLFDDKAR